MAFVRNRFFLGGIASTLLTVVLAIVYWRGLYGGFFFDDEANILLQEGVKLQELTAVAVKAALTSGQSGLFGRSVAQLSFALNHYFGGFDPFAFKATNLIIHVLNGWLVLLVSLRLFDLRANCFSNRTVYLATLSLTAIWLLHPIQLTTILLVVQRMTSLSALFLLAGFYLHIQGRSHQGKVAIRYYFFAWAVLWPLSVFSKETGTLFPIFVLAWELIVRRAVVGSIDRFARFLSVTLGICLAIALGYALSPVGGWLWTGYEFRAFSLPERLLTEARVLWFYLDLIAFPRLGQFGLYHDDLSISKNLFSPWTTMPAIVGCFGLLWLAWWCRKRLPLVSFGLAWFLIGHSMESTALPLELAHEHRNYLPSFGILLAAIAFILRFFERQDWQRTAILASLASFFAYATVITSLRANQFGDVIRRTQIEAQHHPASARAQYEAGQVFSRLAVGAEKDAPIYGMARRHFELAMEVDPAFKVGGLGSIYIDCLRGAGIDRELVRELTSRLERTPFLPGDTAFFSSLKEMQIKGSICLAREDVDSLFNAALRNPRIADHVKAKLHSWHADYLWLSEGDLLSARSSLGQALLLSPWNASNRFKWVQLTFLSGDAGSARKLLDEIPVKDLSTSEQERYREMATALKGEPSPR